MSEVNRGMITIDNTICNGGRIRELKTARAYERSFGIMLLS